MELVHHVQLIHIYYHQQVVLVIKHVKLQPHYQFVQVSMLINWEPVWHVDHWEQHVTALVLKVDSLHNLLRQLQQLVTLQHQQQHLVV